MEDRGIAFPTNYPTEPLLVESFDVQEANKELH